ncbi:6951_t:CDS:1, partial [Dentiscutata heterogama]
MPRDWALPKNTRFVKKSSGKKIKAKFVVYLKQFFLNGNLNLKDKLTAKKMYEELLKLVYSEEIDKDHVPKVTLSKTGLDNIQGNLTKKGQS